MMTASVITPLPSSPASTSSPIPSRRSKKKQQNQKKSSSKKRTKDEWSISTSQDDLDSTLPGESVNNDEDLTPPTKKRKKQVKQACAGCKKAHTRCEESRPCPRCKTLGISCVDAPRKKRKRREENSSEETIMTNSSGNNTNSSYHNSQAVQRTECVDGLEDIRVRRRKTTKRRSGKKAKHYQEEENDYARRGNYQETEGGDGSFSSSPSSNEEFEESPEILPGEELGGVYIYHQHHHLLYNQQDQPVQSLNVFNTANNIQMNNSNGTYNTRDSDTTLSALYYGIVSPTKYYYNNNNSSSNYINTSSSSYTMMNDNQNSGVYGSVNFGESIKNFYYQPEDLQRIRENYLKDWIC